MTRAESFVSPPAAHWNVLIPADGDDLIVHHDLAPWNFDSRAVGCLDLHRLGLRGVRTRLWDLAYAIHGFIPLSANPAHQRPDTDHRLRVFVNAYGLDEQQRQELIPLLSRRCRAMYDFLRA